MFEWYKSMWHFKPIAFSPFTAGVEMRTRPRDKGYTSNWLHAKWGCRVYLLSANEPSKRADDQRADAHHQMFFLQWLFFIYRYSLHQRLWSAGQTDLVCAAVIYLIPHKTCSFALHSASMWWLGICPPLREAPLFRVWGVQSAIPCL